MKKNKFLESIKKMSDDEKLKKLEDLELESSNLRIQSVSQELVNPIRLRFIRREIARIKTIMGKSDLK